MSVSPPLRARHAGTDVELLARTRSGDSWAYGELYHRYHQAALRRARHFARTPADADDLVHEAFAKVLAAIRNGGGPHDHFFSYLAATMRNRAVDQSRRGRWEVSVDEIDLTAMAPVVDGAITMETPILADAFADLPERWRQVLWATEVEGIDAASLAGPLEMTPNAVAALAYRARGGLRRAYAAAYVDGATHPHCAQVARQLAAGLDGDADLDHDVREHLDACGRCTDLVTELRSLRRRTMAVSDAA